MPPAPAGNAKCVRESRKGRGKRARGKESRGGTRERKGKGRRKATGERQKDHIGHQKRQGKKEGREARAREGKGWEKASKERGNRSTDLETERETKGPHRTRPSSQMPQPHAFVTSSAPLPNCTHVWEPRFPRPAPRRPGRSHVHERPGLRGLLGGQC